MSFTGKPLSCLLCVPTHLHMLAVSSTGVPKCPRPTPQSHRAPRSAGSEREAGEMSTQSTGGSASASDWWGLAFVRVCCQCEESKGSPIKVSSYSKASCTRSTLIC